MTTAGILESEGDVVMTGLVVEGVVATVLVEVALVAVLEEVLEELVFEVEEEEAPVVEEDDEEVEAAAEVVDEVVSVDGVGKGKSGNVDVFVIGITGEVALD